MKKVDVAKLSFKERQKVTVPTLSHLVEYIVSIGLIFKQKFPAARSRSEERYSPHLLGIAAVLERKAFDTQSSCLYCW